VELNESVLKRQSIHILKKKRKRKIFLFYWLEYERDGSR
jgi:hypothetical protein